jgi:hypothetical protein
MRNQRQVVERKIAGYKATPAIGTEDNAHGDKIQELRDKSRSRIFCGIPKGLFDA